MLKRFFDSLKFEDPWYRKLSPLHKCFWEFLLCKCDHAGFWKVDMESADWHIGQKLNISEIKDVFNGRVVSLKNDTVWFIPKFIIFQYGNLNPNVKLHQAVMEILKKNNTS